MKSLRAKLSIGFGGLLAILLAVSLVSVIVLTSYSHTLEHIFRENYNSAIYCDQMNDALDALNLRLQRILWHDPGAAQMNQLAEFSRFEQNLDLQLANVTLPGEAELTHRLQSLWKDYKSSYEQFDRAGSGAAEVYRRDLLPQYQHVKEVARQVAAMNMSNMVSVDGRVKRTLLAVRRTLLILVIAGGGLGAILVGTVGATIFQPLRNLILSARRITAGQLDLNMPVRSRDEIGQLTEAFNSMASRLRELKQMDSERLLRTQQTTQLAIDSLRDAVVVIGPDGRAEIANRAAQTHFGIVPGAAVADLKLKWLSEIFAQVVTTGQAFEPEGYKSAIQLFENGRERFLLPRAVPMLDPAGRTIGVAVILVDVTQLRHADELKGGLVSTVSHELRTPLTALRLAVGLLAGEKTGPLTPRQRKLVKAAHDESERLFQIIEELLNISRLESGRAQLDVRPLSPGDLIQSAVEPLRSAFKDKGVHLEIRCPTELPEVAADLTFISHAMGNLLSNALKVTTSGGAVEVTAAAGDGSVWFEVADGGPGIPAEYAERIFEKFFRIPRADGTSGVGLGLAITREIIEAHGGQIEFHNRQTGGCAFRFTLAATTGTRNAPAAVSN